MEAVIISENQKSPKSFLSGYGEGVSAAAFVMAGIVDTIQKQMGDFAFHELPKLLEQQQQATDEMNSLSQQPLSFDTSSNWFADKVDWLFPGTLNTGLIGQEALVQFQIKTTLVENQAEMTNQEINQSVQAKFANPSNQEKAVSSAASNLMYLYDAMGNTRLRG